MGEKIKLVLAISVSCLVTLFAYDYFQLRQQVNSIQTYAIQNRNMVYQAAQQAIQNTPPRPTEPERVNNDKVDVDNAEEG